MIGFDNATMKHILQECKFDVPLYAWKEKEKILFRLKSKYGDAFDKETAGKIYDGMQKEANEPSES